MTKKELVALGANSTAIVDGTNSLVGIEVNGKTYNYEDVYARQELVKKEDEITYGLSEEDEIETINGMGVVDTVARQQLDNIANELKLTGSGNTIKLMLGTKELSSLTISNGTVEPTPTTYGITNNLTNCTNSNTSTSIEENTSYTATISVNSGYKIKTVTITMGGTDITSSVYSNGTITISSVTGDIVITVTTEVDTDVVVGNIDSNNIINLTGLNAGTYTLKYENASGNVLDSFDIVATMEVV